MKERGHLMKSSASGNPIVERGGKMLWEMRVKHISPYLFYRLAMPQGGTDRDAPRRAKSKLQVNLDSFTGTACKRYRKYIIRYGLAFSIPAEQLRCYEVL